MKRALALWPFLTLGADRCAAYSFRLGFWGSAAHPYSHLLRQSAHNCWRPAKKHWGPEYETRWQAITGAISALGSDFSFRILDVEWWRTCCEPGVIDDLRNAGFARLRVAIGGAPGKKIGYVFDVLDGATYWGEMMGCPFRHWEIIDTHPEGEEPLYWKWPA